MKIKIKSICSNLTSIIPEQEAMRTLGALVETSRTWEAARSKQRHGNWICPWNTSSNCSQLQHLQEHMCMSTTCMHFCLDAHLISCRAPKGSLILDQMVKWYFWIYRMQIWSQMGHPNVCLYLDFNIRTTKLHRTQMHSSKLFSSFLNSNPWNQFLHKNETDTASGKL